MPRIFLALMSLLSVLSLADETAACSCAPISPCGAYRTADAVFVGDVVEVRNQGKDGWSSTVKMRVVRLGKGAIEGGELVSVEVPGQDSTCGLDFGVGQRWIIFATRGPAGHSTDPCQGSYQLSPGERLPELPGRGGTVNGWLGRLGRPGRPGGMHEGPPAVPVWIDTPSGRIATRTAADGGFSLVGVPPGRWTIHFDVGPNHTADTEVELGSNDDCYGVHTMVMPAGGLAGSIVDEAGAPVVGAPVTAILATDTEGIYEFGGETDEGGRFLVRALDHGPYLVRIGIDGEANGRVPYRPVFYPAARERSAAKAIEVGGSTVRLEPIVMRAPLATVTLVVDVMCRDGTRPRKTFLTADRMDGEGTRDYSSVQAGDGPPTIRVLAGYRYTVQGMVEVLNKPDGSTGATVVETTVIQVDTDVQPARLRVRADLEGCDAPGGIRAAPR
jgi:hypothetical protein